MSNVIKPGYYIPLDEIKKIEALPKAFNLKSVSSDSGAHAFEPEAEALSDIESLKEQIIKDAEAYAEEQLRSAMEQAERMRAEAQAEIEQWWNERRLADEQVVSEAQDRGREQGYREGVAQAEQAVMEQYQAMMDEARVIVEQAVQVKNQIIQESEPFLIQLSCAIAEKIIGRQLELSPETVTDMIRNVLARRREQGIITLCVAPEHFNFIQNARDELALAIDSQAELQIIPDVTVKDYGCVIRSAFGSIDARIDTQLNEIKHSLQQIAFRSGELVEHD